MESPLTVIFFAGSGDCAGPCFTLPSATANLLPWQGQLMVPPTTVETVHPSWVHTAEKALKSPLAGWVTTTFWSLKTFPPPSGMSEVLASAFPLGDAGALAEAGCELGGAEDCDGGAAGADGVSWVFLFEPPHAASAAASPATPADTTTVRRLVAPEDEDDEGDEDDEDEESDTIAPSVRDEEYEESYGRAVRSVQPLRSGAGVQAE